MCIVYTPEHTVGPIINILDKYIRSLRTIVVCRTAECRAMNLRYQMNPVKLALHSSPEELATACSPLNICYSWDVTAATNRHAQKRMPLHLLHLLRSLFKWKYFSGIIPASLDRLPPPKANFLEMLWQDLLYAWRLLCSSPNRVKAPLSFSEDSRTNKKNNNKEQQQQWISSWSKKQMEFVRWWSFGELDGEMYKNPGGMIHKRLIIQDYANIQDNDQVM